MKLWRSIKNHLVPYHGNAHRPRLLRKPWLVAFLALALMSEAVILGGEAFRQGPSVFLAAVVRSDVISYTEQARLGEGGGVLQENDLLNAAAQAKAEDMAARGYFSHTGPDGESPWTWVARAGYDYVYAGENLAVRFDDSKEVVDAWMASPTHRANIVKPQYQEIGVGLAEGTYKGGPATFVVQFFASPSVAYGEGRASPSLAPAAPAISTVPAAQEPVAGAEVGPADTKAGPMVPQAPAPRQSWAQSAVRGVADALDGSRAGASAALLGLAALLVVILALTFFIRIQVQPTDLLLPGAAVALVVVALISANAAFLSAQMQSASVVLSQGGDIAEGISVERVRVTFPEAPAR
ncbi:MAG TPA: CAP domain-containing protein [Candidatus Paceibacterota bacterium]